MKLITRLFAEHRRVGATLAAVLLMLLLVTVSNLFSGLPDPRQPSPDLFANPDETSWTSQDETNGAVTAFAERPLFSATRRIKVRPPDAEAAPKPEPTGPILSLDKWSLLGIFDSGEVEGALIRHSDGKRHRIRLGERIDGWELVDVEPRSIRFTSAKGRSAELDMALATVEVLPIREASKSGSDDATGTDSDNDAPASEKRTEPRKPSFKGYYGGPRTKDD